MSPYALAIFDFDGTLADSWRLMGQAIIEAADRFGYRRPSPEEAQAMRGLDNGRARIVPAPFGLGLGDGREVERVDDQRSRMDAAEPRRDRPVDRIIVEPGAFPAQSADQAEAAQGQPTISSGLKKKSISILAFSSLSEPWTELASIDSA